MQHSHSQKGITGEGYNFLGSHVKMGQGFGYLGGANILEPSSLK